MVYAYLLQAVLLPIIASPIAYWVGAKYGSKPTTAFAFAVLVYSTFVLIVGSSISNPYFENYNWFPQSISGSALFSSVGNFGLYADGISVPLALIIYVVAIATALYSVPYMKKRIAEMRAERATTEQPVAEIMVTSGTAQSAQLEQEKPHEEQFMKSKFGVYTALCLLFSSGMVGTVLATNLIELYFFYEFMLLPSYFLIAEFGYGQRGRVSVMFLLWTHIGALMMLLSFLAIGINTSSFVFQGPGALVASQIVPYLLPWIVFGVVVGLFVKLGAFGLHVWLPHTYSDSPTPVTVLLSSAMFGIGAYILIRILTLLLPQAYTEISLGIAVWGIVTMFYGGVLALTQNDLKRLLAYSSISQVGYLIFGLSTATSIGVGGSIFQFVSNGTSKAVLFMVAGLIIVQAGGLRNMKQMGGLSQRLPITAVCAGIGFLSILGFPETNGFQSEWLIFAGGLKLGSQVGVIGEYWLVLTTLAVIATIITATYALLAMKRVFFGKLPDSLSQVREGSFYMLAPMIFLAILTIVLGVLPGFVDTPLFHSLANLPIPLR